jgi:hypothetical protein
MSNINFPRKMSYKRIAFLLLVVLFVIFFALEGVSASRHYTEDDLDEDVQDLDDSLHDLEEESFGDDFDEKFDEDEGHLESFEINEDFNEDKYENLEHEMVNDEEAELDESVDEELIDEDVDEEIEGETTLTLPQKEDLYKQDARPAISVGGPNDHVRVLEQVAPVQDVAPVQKAQEEVVSVQELLAQPVQEAAPVQKVASVQDVAPVQAMVQASTTGNVANPPDMLAVDNKGPSIMIMGVATTFASLLLIAIIVASVLVWRQTLT